MPEDPRDAERAAYASEIEDFFLRRRGSARLLPPKDWKLVEDWFEEGIPLAVVLLAVGEVFTKHEAAGRKEPVSSLSYCRHAVRKRWDEIRGGSTGETPRERPARKRRTAAPLEERLRRSAERLRESRPELAAEIESVLPEVARISLAEGSASARETELLPLEERLLARFLAKLPDEERGEVVAEAEAPIGKLRVPPQPADRERLLALGMARVLRKRFVLPKLSLLGDL